MSVPLYGNSTVRMLSPAGAQRTAEEIQAIRDDASRGAYRTRRTPEFWTDVARVEFTDWLNGAVVDDGRSKNELATAMKITLQYLNKIIYGSQTLTIPTINKIAGFFGYRLKLTLVKIEEAAPIQTTPITGR